MPRNKKNKSTTPVSVKVARWSALAAALTVVGSIFNTMWTDRPWWAQPEPAPVIQAASPISAKPVQLSVPMSITVNTNPVSALDALQSISSNNYQTALSREEIKSDDIERFSMERSVSHGSKSANIVGNSFLIPKKIASTWQQNLERFIWRHPKGILIGLVAFLILIIGGIFELLYHQKQKKFKTAILEP